MREWRRSVKIHQGCGGICRFVEAIDQPNTQWTGECLRCHTDNLPLEAMIPVEETNVDRMEDINFQEEIRDTPIEKREQLEWNDDQNWYGNQQRLREELDLRQLGT